jgi:Family of unknown function (DUF6080)
LAGEPLRRRFLLGGLVLVSLAVHLALAIAWWRVGALDQHDVLFDADPDVALEVLRDGQMKDRLWRAHPNWRNLGHPPVMLLAAGARLARPDLTAARARQWAAIALAPIAAAAQTGATFLIAEALGAGPGAASLVALLQTFSFSSLVFGSVPESYALSGAVLSLPFLLAARAARDGRLRMGSTVMAAALAGGITITNLALALLPWIFIAARARRSWASALVRVLAMAVAAATLILLQLVGFNAAYGDRLPWHRAAWRTEPFLGPQPRASLQELPSALATTVLAGRPARVPAEIAVRRHYHYKEMFTSRESLEPAVVRVLRFVAVAALLSLGGYRLSHGSGAPLVRAGVAILIANAALHTIYRGNDLLLYSQHWLPACGVLAAGLAVGSRGERLTLAGAAALAAVLNASVLLEMLGELRSLG